MSGSRGGQLRGPQGQPSTQLRLCGGPASRPLPCGGPAPAQHGPRPARPRRLLQPGREAGLSLPRLFPEEEAVLSTSQVGGVGSWRSGREDLELALGWLGLSGTLDRVLWGLAPMFGETVVPCQVTGSREETGCDLLQEAEGTGWVTWPSCGQNACLGLPGCLPGRALALRVLHSCRGHCFPLSW